jgi:hypothetical protein
LQSAVGVPSCPPAEGWQDLEDACTSMPIGFVPSNLPQCSPLPQSPLNNPSASIGFVPSKRPETPRPRVTGSGSL